MLNEVYDNGGEHVAVFNTVCRVKYKKLWNLLRIAGHKDEIKIIDPNLNGYRKLRIHSIGECNYNRYLPIWGG